MRNTSFVQDFLSEVKANLSSLVVIPRGNSNDPEQRQKDPKAVCDRHGFDGVAATVTEVVRSLTASNFVGLQPDLKNNCGDLFVFRRKYRGVMLYVKLQVSTKTGRVICHSFHEWTNR